MQPLYCASPVSYVPVQVARGALAAHRYIVYLCASSLQNLEVPQDFCFLSVSLRETILPTLYSMMYDWRVSRAGSMLIHCPKLLVPFLSSNDSLLCFFLSIGWYCLSVVFGLIGCKSLSPRAVLPAFLYNNNPTKRHGQYRRYVSGITVPHCSATDMPLKFLY